MRDRFRKRKLGDTRGDVDADERRLRRVLAPAVSPREEFSAALRDQLARELQRQGVAHRVGAGSHDGTGEWIDMDVRRVGTPCLGETTLADIERIDDGRAAEVMRKVNGVLSDAEAHRVDDR